MLSAARKKRKRRTRAAASATARHLSHGARATKKARRSTASDTLSCDVARQSRTPATPHGAAAPRPGSACATVTISGGPDSVSTSSRRWFDNATASANAAVRSGASVFGNVGAIPSGVEVPAKAPESPGFMAALAAAAAESDTLIGLRMLRQAFPLAVHIKRKDAMGVETSVLTRVAPFPIMLESQLRAVITGATAVSRELSCLVREDQTIRMLRCGTGTKDTALAFTTDVVEWVLWRAAQCEKQERRRHIPKKIDSGVSDEDCSDSGGGGGNSAASSSHSQHSGRNARVRAMLLRGAASTGSARREPLGYRPSAVHNTGTPPLRGRHAHTSTVAAGEVGLGASLGGSGEGHDGGDAEVLREFVRFLPKCTDKQVTTATLKKHFLGFHSDYIRVLVNHGLLVRSTENPHAESFWFSVPQVWVSWSGVARCSLHAYLSVWCIVCGVWCGVSRGCCSSPFLRAVPAWRKCSRRLATARCQSKRC